MMEGEKEETITVLDQSPSLENHSQQVGDSSQDSLRTALLLNLVYQQLLQNMESRIQQSLRRNHSIKTKIRSILAHSKSTKTKGKGGTPFIDANGDQPQQNLHTIQNQQQSPYNVLPHIIVPKRWHKKEMEDLSKEIANQNRQSLTNKKMNELSKDSISLDDYQREMDKVRMTSDEQLKKDVTDIDWNKVAEEVGTTNAFDCQLRWFNYDSPVINKGPWTKEEDKRLLLLATKHRGYNWGTIAEELGTSRTMTQCFTRYQRSLNRNILKSEWSKKDDECLTQAVKAFGDKNWSEVSDQLEGRTGQQCLHRWQKTLNPNIKRGKWSEEEDIHLKVAVSEYGIKNWSLVKEHVPGRTDLQCRERYVNVLDPNISTSIWTAEEEARLRESVAKHGVGKWSLVSNDLSPRTDNQCWRKWKMMDQEQSKEYQISLIKKKRALIHNFVGRESERPNLTQDDFEYDRELAVEEIRARKAKYKKKGLPSWMEEEEENSGVSPSDMSLENISYRSGPKRRRGRKKIKEEEEEEEEEEEIELEDDFGEESEGDDFTVNKPTTTSTRAERAAARSSQTHFINNETGSSDAQQEREEVDKETENLLRLKDAQDEETNHVEQQTPTTPRPKRTKSKK
eukprot:TRINITY_DN1363_c0_g2_i1.p1 TRINITY_DN1363_c0_g2~~TRINITY_DN1363_c0_g2_i1.p1  ORF type:complete len:624 (-),score=246.38 TRINITY_DN1363_c0_g2_i1:99-1970(-)